MKMKVVTLIACLLLLACKKNELKKPTDVSMKMDINRNVSAQGHLIFTGGSIILSSFNVNGERQEGSPISFSKSFNTGLNVNFSPSNNIPELVFDIPQGNYYELIITFATVYNSGNNTVIVNGTYTNASSTTFPLVFEFKAADSFSIIGEDDEGAATIILDKNVSASTLIKFDPVYWFATVSNSLFDSATLVDIGGQMTILVNSSTNEDIYDLVVDRMEESTLALW
ncbi:hypothetical protein JYT74_03660 [Crocinitomix catalasitica]|nr:hypothetical protein [Crocinitomix catalasitica]MBN4077600.1 hypothetical protein [bacterium AH-315-C20]